MDIVTTSQILGNVGEFVGAIAVVVTLAYLAVQVRQGFTPLPRTVELSSISSVC